MSTPFVSTQDPTLFFEQFSAKYIPQHSEEVDGYLVSKGQEVGLEPKSSSFLGRGFTRYWNGISYNAEDGAQKIIDCAKKALERLSHTENSTSREVTEKSLAASRTCFAIHHLLIHVSNKKQSATLKKIHQELTDLGLSLLDCAVKTSRRSRLQLACSYGMSHTALELIAKGEPLEEPVETADHYTALLKLAYAKNNFMLCLTLIEKGADPRLAFEADFEINASQLLHVACKQLLLHTALLLVRHGCDVSRPCPEGYVAFQVPAKEKPADPKTTDFYLRLLNQLQLYPDPNSPFSIDAFLAECEAKPELLLNSKEANHFVLPLFFQNRALAKAITNRLSQKAFLDHLKDLKVKYPQNAVDVVEFCHVEVTKEHLAIKPTEFRLEKPPTEVSLEELYTLFDSLNFSKADDPSFFDLKRFQANTRASSIPKLRELLGNFIARIKEKSALIGTPGPKEPGRASFWQFIEWCTKNIIIVLKEPPVTDATCRLKASFIAALIELQLGEQDAGVYFRICQQEYRKICCERVCSESKKIKFEQKIYLLLAKFREELLERCIADKGTLKRLHTYNDLLNHLGEELSIPGYETVEWFKDRLGASDFDAARERFFSLYTPARIQRECIEKALLASNELKEEFTEWCKSHGIKEGVDFDGLSLRVTRMLSQLPKPVVSSKMVA